MNKINEIKQDGRVIGYYTDEFAKQAYKLQQETSKLFLNALLDPVRMTTTQILDAVLPYPTGCRNCGQRQRALKRAAFMDWIDTHRMLSDEEIIKRLKRMA